MLSTPYKGWKPESGKQMAVAGKLPTHSNTPSPFLKDPNNEDIPPRSCAPTERPSDRHVISEAPNWVNPPPDPNPHHRCFVDEEGNFSGWMTKEDEASMLDLHGPEVIAT